MAESMSDSTLMIKSKATVFFHGQITVSIKVTGRMVNSMEKGFI